MRYQGHVLGTAVLLLSVDAHARDGSNNCDDGSSSGKVYGHAFNGLACQVDWLDADVAHGYTSFGQVCNLDVQSELMVNCPLHRTLLSSNAGLNCASATFVYQNGFAPPTGCNLHSRKSYECAIMSTNATGWQGWYWGYTTPPVDLVDTGGGIWATDWKGRIFLSHVTTPSPLKGGSFTLSCVLPPTNHCGGQTCVSLIKWWEAEPGEGG